MQCGWCESKNYAVVEDGVYDHYICEDCDHEWDEVTKDNKKDSCISK